MSANEEPVTLTGRSINLPEGRSVAVMRHPTKKGNFFRFTNGEIETKFILSDEAVAAMLQLLQRQKTDDLIEKIIELSEKEFRGGPSGYQGVWKYIGVKPTPDPDDSRLAT